MALSNINWEITKEALKEIEHLLDCGVCGKLVNKPCTLGGCEHFFCRTCIPDVAGEECPVCRMPSHVKDIQTNRQLSTAVSLVGRLSRLLYSQDQEQPFDKNEEEDEVKEDEEIEEEDDNEKENDDNPATSPSFNPPPPSPQQPSTSVKISSPLTKSPAPVRRTRRVAKQERKQQQLKDSNNKWGIGQGETDKCMSCTRNGAPENKRVKFTPCPVPVAQPDFTEETETRMEEESNVDNNDNNSSITEKESKSRVQNTEEMEDDNDTKNSSKEKERKSGDQKAKDIVQSKRNTRRAKSKVSEVESSDSNSNNQSAAKDTSPQLERKVRRIDKKSPVDVSDKDTEIQTNKSNVLPSKTDQGMDRQDSPSTSSLNLNQGVKRKIKTQNDDKTTKNVLRSKSDEAMDRQDSPSVSSPNSNQGVKRKIKTQKDDKTAKKKSPPNDLNAEKTISKTISKNANESLESLASSIDTPKSSRQRRKLSINSPHASTSAQPWMTPMQVTPGVRTRHSVSPRGGASPFFGTPLSKKNVKGETPLHVACIKGEHDVVVTLLQEGAAINAKDHAGWTPLHEACNHGHAAIVQTLLEEGALINVPGLENDTPLHDAVRNNRVECVHLLLERGASTNARNVHGETAHDLASTNAMREAMATPADEDLVRSSQVVHVEPVEMILLATGLSRDQKATLQKCAAMLKCQLHTEFSEKVTHVVSWVNAEGQCVRTMKYLQAILTGKWIVNFQWVETCLEYGERVSEEAFEVPGARTAPDSLAPAEGRNNMMMQRPGLFAGCHVFLSGKFEAPTTQTSREDLTSILKQGGATILAREPRAEHLESEPCTIPYHAREGTRLERCSHYVVWEGVVEERIEADRRLCHVKASWIMDSIAHFKLLDIP